ncbi:pseudouridine synthase [Ornithinimicrobium sp. Arc0846-15]|nr:pseudouridine synthase [Ornithinimicrobium laminariae]
MARRPKRPPPLSTRDGLGPARVRMPPGRAESTVVAFLESVTGDPLGVARRLAEREVLLADGSVVDRDTAYLPGGLVFLYRDMPDEIEVPGQIHILYRDDNIVVVDKPPFLATMPRGSHVVQTAVVQLRRKYSLESIAPAHRLDRLTSGVLLLTLRPQVRRAYQELFASQQVTKEYQAIAPLIDRPMPLRIENRLERVRGDHCTRIVTGEPNAVTDIDVVGVRDGLAQYRLAPSTGKTHQLRAHLAGQGAPIVGDPLYGTQARPDDDFSRPLQLLAHRLTFIDPINGKPREFVAQRELMTLAQASAATSGLTT